MIYVRMYRGGGEFSRCRMYDQFGRYGTVVPNTRAW